MLVIDISMNRQSFIDEIFIQRVGGTPPGNCKYQIKRPEGYEDKIFIHRYSDGYFILLFKVLNYLKKQGYKPTPSEFDMIRNLLLNKP